ncbi:MAG: GldM family protein [Fluviicola sp.]
MKSLFLGLSLLFSSTSFSQVIGLEQPELMVLYRGYNNKILVNVPEGSERSVNDIELQGINYSAVKANKPGGFIVKPGKGTTTTLTLHTMDGDTLKEIYRAEYVVRNLPDPILFWGASKSGVKGSRSSRILLAKYTPEIPLEANFKVTSWTLTANGEQASGTGGNLSQAGPIIKKAEPGSQVAITAVVVGPDGIARSVGGAWEL